MTNELASRQCVPCRGGVAPLKGAQIEELHGKLESNWRVVDEHHLSRGFAFKNFRQALDFTNRVGELAESQGHHPEICLGWGRVVLEVWTHKIDGLTESDFIFAAKVDRLKTQ